MIACLLLVSGLAAAVPAAGPDAPYLYRTTLVQAAPGKLLEVVELLKAGWPGSKESGDEPPIAMRHSQGDRWDLLLLFPMGGWSAYYAPERVARRDRARASAKAELSRLESDVAWTEDVFVYGPPLEALRGQFEGAGFFHVEMFQALPGQIAGLYRQREMENAYLKALDQPRNAIFVRDAGAAVGRLHDRGVPRPEALRRERRRARGETGGGGEGRRIRGCEGDRALPADLHRPPPRHAGDRDQVTAPRGAVIPRA